MPTRILREGIITSEAVNSLSEPTELFYRRLMSVADDYGRYYAHPSLLRAACYPLRLETKSEANVKQMLNECVSAGLVTIYNGGKHLQIENFRQQTRAKSKFPEPNGHERLIKRTSNDKQMLSLDGDEGVSSETKTNANAETCPRIALQSENWVEVCALCRDVLGDKTYDSEDQWSLRAMNEPEKLRRVMADLKVAIAEGKKIRNKAAYAEDLWKRFK